MATVDPPDVKWALKTVRRIDKTNERFVTRNHSGAFGFGPFQSYYIYDNRVLEGWADSCPSTETTPQLCLRGWHVHRLAHLVDQKDLHGQLDPYDMRVMGNQMWLVQVAGPWKQDNRKATHRYIRFHTKLTKQDIEELRGCTTRSQVRRVLGFGANEGVVW